MDKESILKKLEDMSPFKRVVVPQNLIDRYNEEFPGDNDVRELAFTVNKETKDMNDEELWDLMVESKRAFKNAKPLDFGDRKHNPPDTGREKQKL